MRERKKPAFTRIFSNNFSFFSISTLMVFLFQNKYWQPPSWFWLFFHQSMCVYMSAKSTKQSNRKWKLSNPWGKKCRIFFFCQISYLTKLLSTEYWSTQSKTNKQKMIQGKKTYLVQNSIALATNNTIIDIEKKANILYSRMKIFFSLAVTHIISFWNDQWWWWWW